MTLVDQDADLGKLLRNYFAEPGATDDAEGIDEYQFVICAVLRGFASIVVQRTFASRFEGISAEAAEDIGSEAARNAASFAAWSTAIGERLDTSQVCHMLDVSRQALAKRQKHGSLVGLAGRRSTWFPAWQFDQAERSVRPIVADITAAFREKLGEVDPMLIASWATRHQHEDLEGSTPADWIENGKDPDWVVRAAHRAASRLAQ